MPPVSRETSEPEPVVLEGLFGSRVPLVRAYAALLTGAAVERGLLGPREAPRVWSRHILNCAVVEPVFPVGSSVCDVGSGAGLPGIVLALARPDLRITLLEPLLRRATFLSEVVESLGVANLVVRRGRAEDLVGEQQYDGVTARAVAPLETLAGWGLPLVRAGGELVAFKGESAAAEVEAARATLARWGVGRIEIESYGAGMVEPLTTVVRIESSGKRPPRTKGSR